MRLNERGEMPNETIAATLVDNGPDGAYVNTLQILWGPKGGAPDAPDGWVNAGYAQLVIRRTDEDEISSAVILDDVEMDRLIRTLKKVRRGAFRAPSRLDAARQRALTDKEVDFHLKSVGLG